jgi:hypothetical protein
MQDVSWEIRYQVAGLVGALAAARRTDSSGLHLGVAGPLIDELAELCGIEPYKLPVEREGAELDAVASRKAPEAPEADRGSGSVHVSRREHPGAVWPPLELVSTGNVTRAWALGFAARYYLNRAWALSGEWGLVEGDDAADYYAGYAAARALEGPDGELR